MGMMGGIGLSRQRRVSSGGCAKPSHLQYYKLSHFLWTVSGHPAWAHQSHNLCFIQFQLLFPISHTPILSVKQLYQRQVIGKRYIKRTNTILNLVFVFARILLLLFNPTLHGNTNTLHCIPQ